MKPLQGGPATAIRIPVVLCGAPSVKTKTLSTKKKGPECSTDRGLTESSGEVFLLDILSHRVSVMGMFRQLTVISRKGALPQREKQTRCRPVASRPSALAWRGTPRSRRKWLRRRGQTLGFAAKWGLLRRRVSALP